MWARTAASSECSWRKARSVARSSSCSSVNARSRAMEGSPLVRSAWWRARRSGARHVLPGDVLVDARLAGQPEHALAQDVAHDLGGAALDRVRARAQELILGETLAGVGTLAALAQLVAGLVGECVRAEHVDRSLP